MVNTGLSFFPARLMNKMPVNPYFEPGNLTKQEYNYGDDMYISKFQKCYATELLHKDGMTALPECGVGVSHHGPHMEIRNALCRRYWGDKIK